MKNGAHSEAPVTERIDQLEDRARRVDAALTRVEATQADGRKLDAILVALTKLTAAVAWRAVSEVDGLEADFPAYPGSREAKRGHAEISNAAAQ
jgi:hypothetical protein